MNLSGIPLVFCVLNIYIYHNMCNKGQISERFQSRDFRPHGNSPASRRPKKKNKQLTSKINLSDQHNWFRLHRFNLWKIVYSRERPTISLIFYLCSYMVLSPPISYIYSIRHSAYSSSQTSRKLQLNTPWAFHISLLNAIIASHLRFTITICDLCASFARRMEMGYVELICAQAPDSGYSFREILSFQFSKIKFKGLMHACK